MLACALFSGWAAPSLTRDGSLPWINELDYDSNDGGFNDDRDEFVEITTPVG